MITSQMAAGLFGGDEQQMLETTIRFRKLLSKGTNESFDVDPGMSLSFVARA